MTPDLYFLEIYKMFAGTALLCYIGITMYAFIVRDPNNNMTIIAMDMFAIFSFPGKLQILLSLIHVFFGILFLQKDFTGMATAMFIASAFVFIFHSAQPFLYEMGERRGMR